ncbi:MAG: DUF1538 domain-containing protein [Eubacteriales bacterium]|nr:DUF1538 domain-containing protein [Eubacteriales bacterium]
MSVLREKIQEVIASVLPVSLFVVLLQVLFHPLNGLQFGQFLFAALVLILGMAIFLLGIDISITPMGRSLSAGIVRRSKLPSILGAAFAMGFLINIAEPDLMILARNINSLTQGTISYSQLMVAISLGVGLMVMFSFLRLIKHIRLKYIYLTVYGLSFLLAALSPGEYLALAFDSCGATTGAITTPFLLALALGLAAVTHDNKRDGSESFGLVGMASSGAVIAVLILGIMSGGSELTGQLTFPAASESFFEPFREAFQPMLRSALTAILPLATIFFAINSLTKETRRREYSRIIVGLIYCILGLTIFTMGVEGGFMLSGHLIAMHIVNNYQAWYLLPLGFFLGMTTVLAEPAVQVLTKQIQTQTSGTISRKLVMIFLSGGVAIAVVLAMLRILVPGLELWYILLPAYIIAVALTFVTGDLFTGIAFDSGGVVSGPMTATFVLAFTQGAAYAVDPASVIRNGYGIIALVATSPLLALQILGLIYKLKEAKEARIAAAERLQEQAESGGQSAAQQTLSQES